MGESWLLLGAPGVGKSTFSYNLKKQARSIKQFSVRLYTEKVLEKKNELANYLIENHIVQPKKYMPDDVVERIFADFLSTTQKTDFLLIEGYPINDEQFKGLIYQLKQYERTINGILILEDFYDDILMRIKNRQVCMMCEKKSGGGIPIPSSAERCPFCGGLLTKRPEDDVDFFNIRYKMYLSEKKNICQWFAPEIIHEVFIKPDEIEILSKIWSNKLELY